MSLAAVKPAGNVQEAIRLLKQAEKVKAQNAALRASNAVLKKQDGEAGFGPLVMIGVVIASFWVLNRGEKKRKSRK